MMHMSAVSVLFTIRNALTIFLFNCSASAILVCDSSSISIILQRLVNVMMSDGQENNVTVFHSFKMIRTLRLTETEPSH